MTISGEWWKLGLICMDTNLLALKNSVMKRHVWEHEMDWPR